jgi:hypothetical protein
MVVLTLLLGICSISTIACKPSVNYSMSRNDSLHSLRLHRVLDTLCVLVVDSLRSCSFRFNPERSGHLNSIPV